ncbi:MAG: hypothetical protein AAB693_01085 [Patescibacteria group bacterium]
MNYFSKKVKLASIIGLVAAGLDLLFHATLTEPMETFDYFVVKALLGFLVATLFLNWQVGAEDTSNINKFNLVLIASGGFSFLMSLYYRWWEFFRSRQCFIIWSYLVYRPRFIFPNWHLNCKKSD